MATEVISKGIHF